MFAWNPVNRTGISQKMLVWVTCATRRFISQLRKVEQCSHSSFSFTSLRLGEKRFGGIVTLHSQTDLSGCTPLDKDTEACTILSAITCKENLEIQEITEIQEEGQWEDFSLRSSNKSTWTDWEKKIPNEPSAIFLVTGILE